MAILKLVKSGDELEGQLYKTCRPVGVVTPRIVRLLDDMIDTLHETGGVGLAAPQVGVLRRVVIVEVDEGDVIELIDPEIVYVDGEQEGMEGCLSFPGEWGIVKRPLTVTVKAKDRNGKEFEVTGTRLKARAFCHEIDHLEGVVFKSRADRMLSPEEIENS